MALVKKSVKSEQNRPGAATETADGTEATVFKVLVKKSGKAAVKDIAVPENSSLQAARRDTSQEERIERNKLKGRVLAYNDMVQEEERIAERQHMLASRRGRGPKQDRLLEGSRNNVHVAAPTGTDRKAGRDRGRTHGNADADFDMIEERARRQGGTSRGGWKGADALGIDFEL